MDVVVRPFALPLSRPLSTADGRIDRRRGFLVRVADGEAVGLGEATPLPGWTESVEECRDALSRASSRLPESAETALAELAGTPAARHGLSLALADLRARERGTPLARKLWAGESADPVPVNATVGDAPRERTAGRALAAVEAGYECVKVKVGARSIEDDVARLRAVREAVGGTVELRADANGAWSRDQARRALDRVAALDVAVVEQPLPATDLDGLADLRGGAVDVAVDEALARAPPAAVLDAGAADVLVLKPMALGGVERAARAARSAVSAGVRAVVTTTVDGVVARTAAVHLAAGLPDAPACGLATANRLAGDLGPDPAPVRDGEVRVPTDPGLGVEEVWPP